MNAGEFVECRSAELAPVVRLELTRRLHDMAEGMRGEPVLYELAAAAPGLLEDTLRSPAASARLQPAMPAAAHSPEAESQSTAADVQSIAAPLANGASQRSSHRRQPPIDVPAESRRLKVFPSWLDVFDVHGRDCRFLCHYGWAVWV